MATTRTIYQVPGPIGAAGAAGADGTDGTNAYATTAAQFTMPAEGADVTVSVDTSDWASIGQIVHVQGAGYMEVAALPSSTQMTLTNLEVTATGVYADNVAPATVVATSKTVAPSGLQGVAGTAGLDYTADNELASLAGLTSAADKLPYFTGSGTAALADLTSTARTFLASGSKAVAQQSLDLEVGVDVQEYDAELAALAGLTSAADKLPYLTGSGTAAVVSFLATAQAFVAAASEAAARAAISAAESGANSDITSLAGLTTALSAAQGGTGVEALPYFHVNLNGVDQTGIVSGASTKVQFDTEVADSNSDFDITTYRFTPTAAGAYAFHAAITVNALAAGGDIVKAHIYKNGALAATGQSVAEATEAVQAQVNTVLVANGTTDYFELFVEHDAGVNKDVEGDEEVTYWSAHWCG